jgi:hypothetical protein
LFRLWGIIPKPLPVIPVTLKSGRLPARDPNQALSHLTARSGELRNTLAQPRSEPVDLLLAI